MIKIDTNVTLSDFKIYEMDISKFLFYLSPDLLGTRFFLLVITL